MGIKPKRNLALELMQGLREIELHRKGEITLRAHEVEASTRPDGAFREESSSAPEEVISGKVKTIAWTKVRADRNRRRGL